MADKPQEGGKEGSDAAGGYLSSAASYLPSLPGRSQVTDTAKDAPGQAQKGAGAVGDGLKTVTSPVPIVGSVVEGVGNAPIAQKIGGKEEKPGYLGQVYNLAGDAVRTVYDAAGNVIGTVSHKTGEYLHGGEKKGEADVEKDEALEKDQEAIKNSATEKTQETADSATEKTKETAGKLSETAGATTEKVKSGHRGVEDNVQSGVTDGVNTLRESSGTKEATSGASQGLESTADATKGTARGVEDGLTDTGGKVAGGVGKGNMEGAGDAAGGVKDGLVHTGSSVGEGAKGVASGGTETVKGVGEGLGAGASSAASGLGGLTGLGGK